MSKKINETLYLEVEDFSVSKEKFKLIPHSEYGFLETTPKPSLSNLPDYYKSEDYISHTDAKRNVFEKVYHLVKKYASGKKLKLINAYTKNEKHLLDVGCGTGDFLQTAKNNNWHITGIEPNEDARGVANKKTNSCVFDTSKLESLPNNSFNVITLWHVLEHLPNLEKDINTFKKLLKPNGVLIIAVPNYKSYDALYYKNYWAALDVPRHLWHFNKASMVGLLKKFGLHVIKIKPMFFDAFYVSFLSEKYKTGKINFIRGFYVGLKSNIKYFKSKEASSLIYIVKKE